MLCWKRWGAGSCGLALLIATILPTQAAEAQIFGSDPEGVKQTDNLIKKAEEVVEESVSAREQLAKTLDTYNAIFADGTTDVRKAYRDVEGEMKKTEERRLEVRKKIDEMKTEADAYFAGWTESLQQIGSEDLRSRSEARMAETRARFDGILAAANEARDAYEPFMANLKDQWTYLGSDLNPNGIASLKPDADKLNQEGQVLFEKIDAGMDKANEYIASLRSSRPAS